MRGRFLRRSGGFAWPQGDRVSRRARAKKRRKIYDPASPGWVLNFIVAAHFPFVRVRHCARTNHVQVDVRNASGQMTVGLNRRRVIAILPESATPFLPRIELLSHSSLYKLQRTGYLIASLVRAKQVNMIAGHNVIQDGQAVTPLRFEEPVPPAATVPQELQQELPLMTAMRDVPDVARAENTVGSGHGARVSIFGHKRAI